MKRCFLLTIAVIFAMSISAQKINIVGTWKEVDPNQYQNQVLNESIVVRTWIFSTDGTKTLKGRQQLTYPIGGINCTFDMVQSRTDEKWTLNGKTLTMEDEAQEEYNKLANKTNGKSIEQVTKDTDSQFGDTDEKYDEAVKSGAFN